MLETTKNNIGFLYHKSVRMADGTSRRIKDIPVNSLVLGLDQNKQLIPSKVLVASVSEVDAWNKIKGTRIGMDRGANEFSLICGSEQQLYMPSGCKVARRFTIKDKSILIRQDVSLKPAQFQILLGKLLGDGYLSLNHDSSTAKITFGHTTKDIEYLQWTKRGLSESFCRSERTRISGYGSEMIDVNTVTCNSIYEAFKDFVPKSSDHKIIPKWIIEQLTPLSLAFWYMDDGSLCHSDGQEDRAQFATCAFSEQECSILQKALNKLGIDSEFRATQNKNNPNHHSRLYLNADNAEKLFLMILPFIPPCMQRKLPERYRGNTGWIPVASFEYKPYLVQQKITATEKLDIDTNKGYSLITETGNYFVADVLVEC